MKKRSIPFVWLFASAVILATNNVLSFIENIMKWDIIVYGFIIVIMGFSLYNLEAIRELLT
jgi:uncharacterized membrane protein YfhO